MIKPDFIDINHTHLSLNNTNTYTPIENNLNKEQETKTKDKKENAINLNKENNKNRGGWYDDEDLDKNKDISSKKSGYKAFISKRDQVKSNNNDIERNEQIEKVDKFQNDTKKIYPFIKKKQEIKTKENEETKENNNIIDDLFLASEIKENPNKDSNLYSEISFVGVKDDKYDEKVNQKNLLENLEKVYSNSYMNSVPVQNQPSYNIDNFLSNTYQNSYQHTQTPKNNLYLNNNYYNYYNQNSASYNNYNIESSKSKESQNAIKEDKLKDKLGFIASMLKNNY